MHKTKKRPLENKISQSIDFAVFHELQLEDIKIKRNNEVKYQTKDELSHYAYLYNSTENTSEYAIYLILNDDTIPTRLHSDPITLDSNQEGIYTIDVPRDLIPLGSDYYFMITATPNISLEDNGIRKAWHEDINTKSSFSQNFKVIE